MRTLLYARYSTDLQNVLSCADQFDSLQERADREGWTVVGRFSDDEISGRAGISELQRPGLNAMLARVELGDIDQVLAEATDRVARHGGDSHAIREHLEYHGARLFTLADGHVDEIVGTIKGLMDARYLKELGDRIRRGQRGQHGRGFNPGGKAYGYDVWKPIGPDGEIIRGMLKVNEEQAAIVRRIYDEIISGLSPYTIIRRLNAEGVPSPSGKKWSVGTLHGDRTRLTGILRNPLYRGVMIYNRSRRIYHYKTRQRQIRINPEAEWRTIEVPHLRILTDEQFDWVANHYAQFESTPASAQRRPKRLLSGLGRCSVCGSRWAVISANSWGCSLWKRNRGCDHNRTISALKYERFVLDQLKAILLDTDAAALFVDRYNESLRRRLAELTANRAPLERRQAEARERVRRLVDAIAEGGNEFTEIRDRLRAAKADLAAIEQQLSSYADDAPILAPVDLGERYRDFVTDLDAALATDGPERERAAAAIRSLIDVIIVSPKANGRGVDVRVEGRMAEIINLARQELVTL